MAPPKSATAKKQQQHHESSSSKSTSQQDELSSALKSAISTYKSDTPARLRLIDTFMVFYLVCGISYFLYAILVNSDPLNAFLATFSSTVGQFVLLASLRSQVNPANSKTFEHTTQERAFGEFIFASLVLHVFVFSFLG